MRCCTSSEGTRSTKYYKCISVCTRLYDAILLKADVIETLPYGCVTWILNAKHFAKLER